MLGDSSSTPLGSSSGDAPAAAPVGSGLDGGGGDEFGDRSFGGNRWPRQETIALLQIRSDMDGVFRDASVKGPLWEEVSRSESIIYIVLHNTQAHTHIHICLMSVPNTATS